MRFADPQSCPDCRGVIAGQTTCPHCGLDLASPEVRQLWQVLLQADELLARAVQKRTPVAPAAQPTPPQPTPPEQPPPPAGAFESPVATPSSPPPTYLPYPTPQAGPRVTKERSWSVGTILLVLGAFGLIVAGLIFVTRSWEDIGLAGRTLILLGVTAVIGGLGVWVTRRPLRASAEAVWTVFLALLTLDFFAARHEGFAGLGSVDLAWAWVVWGAVVLAISLGIAVWARPHVAAALVAPAVAGGLGITLAGIGAGNVPVDLDFGWRAIIAGVVAGLLALTTRPAGLGPMTLVARLVFAGFFATAYVSALVELVNHPELDEMFGGGHGVPMMIMAAASLVVGAVVLPVRVPAVALSVLAICAIVVTAASQGWDPEGVWIAIAGLSAVLVVGASRWSGAWLQGVRWGAVPVIGGIVLLHVALLTDVLETIDAILQDPWAAPADLRLDLAAVENHETVAVLLCVLALLVVAWFLPRWPELSVVRPQAITVVAGAVALGSVDAVVATRLPIWAAVTVLLVVAAGLVLVQMRGPASFAWIAALLVVAAASALAAASSGASAAVWLIGAAAMAALARVDGRPLTRMVSSGAAVALGLGGLAAAVELLEVDDLVTPLVVLVAALLVLAGAGVWLRGAERPVVEGVAALGGFSALVVEAPSAELAVRWTIVGVALIVMSFVVEGRRWYVWPGIASLVVAYILLIVDSGFSFVEAYTLPLGAAALGIGLHLARRRPETSTWLLLGPGLALSLLPSVPQALADPTDLRAALLGVGAVVVLVLGARLDWQAPFVVGVTVVVLLLLFNIGPYANAAPRVVLIAVVSAILLGVGITWEDRVRDGRRIVGYVRAMR